MNAKSEHTPPFKRSVTLTTTQWQQARRMWRKDKDTHDIACALGCTESHVYNGMYFLKAKELPA